VLLHYNFASEIQSMSTSPWYGTPRDLKWSPTEKAIARTVFDRALRQELNALILETKQMAENVKQPSELWDLEQYLTQRRKEIDRKYDYRYSVLPIVFGNLVREGRLREEDLSGLGPDKLEYIHRAAMY
jgi:Photoprotection regulator fluorescence recovery protein